MLKKLLFGFVLIISIMFITIIGIGHLDYYTNVSPLVVSETEDVNKIYISNRTTDDYSNRIPYTMHNLIISNLKNAKPYCKSETDFVYSYYEVKIGVSADDGYNLYYLYVDDGKYYCEVPYRGVYIIDQELYDYCIEFLADK